MTSTFVGEKGLFNAALNSKNLLAFLFPNNLFNSLSTQFTLSTPEQKEDFTVMGGRGGDHPPTPLDHIH